MLYIIGGASRVGKSTLAQILLERDKVAYVDIDWIVSMLMHASPQLNIKYATEFSNSAFIEKANNFFPYLYQFIKYNQPVVDKYTIEGDSILPKQVHQLQKEFSIKACFLGVSTLKPETLYEYKSKNNWIKVLTPEQIIALCNWSVSVSNYLQNECELYKIPYFDLSHDYHNALEKAYSSLHD